MPWNHQINSFQPINLQFSQIDDEISNSQGAKIQKQKLAVSDDVLDSAKRLILDKIKAAKEEADRNRLAEDTNNRLMIMEEMLLSLMLTKKKE